MNDVTECKALLNEANLFKEHELKFNPSVRVAGKNFSVTPRHPISRYYIASFSKIPDSLEQWRAYGNICIGLDAAQLKRNGFYLYECVYTKAAIKKWILAKANAPEWQLATGGNGNERDAAAFALLFAAMMKFKHSCYRNEREIRLLAVASHQWRYPNSAPMYDLEPPIHFRSSTTLSLPIPYVKFFVSSGFTPYDSGDDYGQKTPLEIKGEKRQWEKARPRSLLPIREVWVGPSPHQEQTIRACNILLSEKGYTTQIKPSLLPYRGC